MKFNRSIFIKLILLCTVWVVINQKGQLGARTICPALFDSSDICSDDFSSLELDPLVWKFIDPVGDASFQITGSHLKIFLPEGSDHDIWKTGNRSARLLQTANNTDFQVEAHFDIQLSRQYTMHGIIVQGDEDNFIRFEVNCIPKVLRIFAASFVDGEPKTRIFKDIKDNGIVYMRIKREGDNWTQSYSYDRQEWFVGGTFSHPLKVTEIGPFAANAGVFPTLTLSMDYFMNRAMPIHPEDHVTSIPQAPALLSAEAISMSEIRLKWTDNSDTEDSFVIERSTNGLEFERIASVGANVTEYIDKIESSGGDYDYRVAASNDSGESGTSDPVLTRLPIVPVISFFYGDTQKFGHLGTPQRYVNILGNVSDADIVDHVLYSLNGDPEELLRIGADRMRLGYPGDFNIEIEPRWLNQGLNTITVRAKTTDNTIASKTVDIIWTETPSIPPTCTIKWNEVHSIQDVAQVIDGKWEISNGMLRNVEVGFDRLIAIGDTLWKDYEITIPVTMHNFYSSSAEGGGSGVGILARWKGHTGDDVPRLGHPYGMLAWYRKSYDAAMGYRLCMHKNGDYLAAEDSTGHTLELHKPYVFKLKVNTITERNTEYSFKVWAQDELEPDDWCLTDTTMGPSAGSIVLVSHKADISFGDIMINNVTNAAITKDFISERSSIATLFYPNPFNGRTFMKINLNRPQPVRLSIYNVLGELVADYQHTIMATGEHTLRWDGKNRAGQHVSNGVYFCKLQIGIQFFDQRIVLIR